MRKVLQFQDRDQKGSDLGHQRHQSKGRRQAVRGRLAEGKHLVLGGPQTLLTVVQGRLEARGLLQSMALNLSFPPGGGDMVGLLTAKGPIRLVLVWHFQLLKFALGPVMQWEGHGLGAASMTTDFPDDSLPLFTSDVELSPR